MGSSASAPKLGPNSASFSLSYRASCCPRAIISGRRLPKKFKGRVEPLVWIQIVDACLATVADTDYLSQRRIQNQSALIALAVIISMMCIVVGVILTLLGAVFEDDAMTIWGVWFDIAVFICIVFAVFAGKSQRRAMRVWKAVAEAALKERCLELQTRSGLSIRVKSPPHETKVVITIGSDQPDSNVMIEMSAPSSAVGQVALMWCPRCKGPINPPNPCPACGTTLSLQPVVSSV